MCRSLDTSNALDCDENSNTSEENSNTSEENSNTNARTPRTSGIEQGKNSLVLHVKQRNAEGLKVDLGHFLSVLLGIEGSLSKHDGVFLGGHTKLVVVGVMPDLLHVVPGSDDTVCVGV